MFGSSFQVNWFLPDGWQEFLCTVVTAACISGAPATDATADAEDPQPQAAAVQTKETTPPKSQTAPAAEQKPAAADQPKTVTVQIDATPSVIEEGGVFELNWHAENATNCQASGAWARARATSGSLTIKTLRKDATYRLSCSGVGATGAMASTRVRIRETQKVNLNFRVSPAAVKPGESAELVWNAKNADACTAEGDWQGDLEASGRFDTGALAEDATYSIRCRNADDEDVSLVRVRVNAERFKLSWQAPGQNVDGSRAQDISGYRIYWGSRPDNYYGSTTIHSADTTEWEPDLSPGVYYFAISAFDSLGNESEKSEPLRAKI